MSRLGWATTAWTLPELLLRFSMTLVTFSAFLADNHLRKLRSALSFHTQIEIYRPAERNHETLIHYAVGMFSQGQNDDHHTHAI